jgi:hypothetical protein
MENGDYVNVYGEMISLDGLDAEERALVNRLHRRVRAKPSWCDFRNFALGLVGKFYDNRGISRKKSEHEPGISHCTGPRHQAGSCRAEDQTAGPWLWRGAGAPGIALSDAGRVLPGSRLLSRHVEPKAFYEYGRNSIRFFISGGSRTFAINSRSRMA